MKRTVAVLLALMMLFVCVGCSEKEPAELSVIQATYSVKSAGGEFIVEVQDLGGVYSELYDPNGIYIQFAKGGKIYDKDGKELTKNDLVIGDTLEIHYDGQLHKNHPKTIKAYKVVKIV